MQSFSNSPGQIETTEPLERTWRLTQSDIVTSDGVGIDASRMGRKDLKLDTGGIKLRWSRNGRRCLLGGKRGFIASVDWMGDPTKNMVKEINVGETVRDVTYLNSHHHIAIAQSKNLFIYDQDLVELHKMKNLIEPAFLEYLSYHWLLVCAGLPGILSYLDVSTGMIVAQHRPKIGSPTSLAHNVHNAVVYWGSGNGTVTLWTPSSPTPHVRLLAHLGPVSAISVDPSQGGRYFATAGVDSRVKIWDSRNYAHPVRQWSPRSGHAVALEWSQRGTLAVAAGSSVNMYTGSVLHRSATIRQNDEEAHGRIRSLLPSLYLTHPLPSGGKPAVSVRWQPFTDVLGIGHGVGLSTILVPGSGEANLDSSEGADPFETKKRRAEREVRSLLEKIPPDMITLNPDVVGSLAPPSKPPSTSGLADTNANVQFRVLSRMERLRTQGKLIEESSKIVEDDENENEDEDENKDEKDTKQSTRKPHRKDIKEKMKMRGRNKTLKRYLRKKRKNIIDARVLNLRAKLEQQKVEAKPEFTKVGFSALDRFKQR